MKLRFSIFILEPTSLQLNVNNPLKQQFSQVSNKKRNIPLYLLSASWAYIVSSAPWSHITAQTSTAPKYCASTARGIKARLGVTEQRARSKWSKHFFEENNAMEVRIKKQFRDRVRFSKGCEHGQILMKIIKNKSCVMNTTACYVIMYIQNDIMMFKNVI